MTKRALFALPLAVAATLGLAQSALAVPGSGPVLPSPSVSPPSAVTAVDRTCYKGEFCVYKDANFSTSNTMLRTTAKFDNWFWDFRALNDEDSSWANKWSVPATVYKDANHTGGVTVCRLPNTQLGYSATANDKGSSHKWAGGSAC